MRHVRVGHLPVPLFKEFVNQLVIIYGSAVISGRKAMNWSPALVARSPQLKDTKRARSVLASVWQKHICHNANDALWLACVACPPRHPSTIWPSWAAETT